MWTEFLGQTLNVFNTWVICIKCFKVSVTYGGVILSSMTWFSSIHLRRITNIFSWIFLVYENKFFQFLIYLMIINTFKLMKKKLCYLSILDTETEAAYNNYKSYDWKLSMLWFPVMITSKKRDLPRIEHAHYH